MPCSDHRDTITESGGTELGVGAVADGEYLRRVGDEVVGDSVSGSATPPGTLVMWAGMGPMVPAGWLLCDGTTYDQFLYASLFAAIGTAFNTGGELPTEFRVPDLRGRFPQGANVEPDRGGTGGASTHTHNVLGTVPRGTTAPTAATAGAQVIGPTSHLPPYQYLHFIVKT